MGVGPDNLEDRVVENTRQPTFETAGRWEDHIAERQRVLYELGKDIQRGTIDGWSALYKIVDGKREPLEYNGRLTRFEGAYLNGKRLCISTSIESYSAL